LAEEELEHDNAVESNPPGPVSATPPPSSPLSHLLPFQLATLTFKILKISRLKILLLLVPFAAWPWRHGDTTSYRLPATATAGTAFAES
jgi:hypothetical protein